MSRRRSTVADPLFRGDAHDSVSVPTPRSRTSIVAHIMYFGSFGRETPFTSLTEVEDVARHFAGDAGAVWTTDASRATSAGARHWSQKQLLDNLRGFGKGKAKWNDKWEVAQARLRVADWSEHLLDWSEVEPAGIDARVASVFDRRGRGRSR